MENPGRVECAGAAFRKRRTRTYRRPKQDQFPLSDDVGKATSDDEDGMNPTRKEVNINQFVNRVYSGSRTDGVKVRVENKGEGEFKGSYDNEPGWGALTSKRCSEGVLAPANWKSSRDRDLRDGNVYSGSNGDSHSLYYSRGISDAPGSDGKVGKVKLKVGGETRTLQSNSTANGGSSLNMSLYSDSSKSDKKQEIQDNLEEKHLASGERPGLQGVPWKTFPRGCFFLGKEESSMGRASGKSTMKQVNKSEPVRKSKRAPKKHALDGDFGEDYEDDEIRYLEKLRAPRTMLEGYNKDDDESKQKHMKLSSVGKVGALRLKDGKKKPSAEDEDYDDQELDLDLDLETRKTKMQKKEPVGSLLEGDREITLTTRQRALQSSKNGSSASGANLIQFPDGLPPAPPRKQKEKLSETEQQIKKAEAAERRRLQNEKAARESEAEAIRKILGQDSSRKKREDKIKKRQQELAQEKAANALTSNTVRWVTCPTGTVVTFPTDMGLPSIFNSKPVSYPPPREKCAGPSCSNPYRYRDSKSKLPLCSLECYKAVEGRTQTETIR